MEEKRDEQTYLHLLDKSEMREKLIDSFFNTAMPIVVDNKSLMIYTV